jgi:subfamily B ATP-binding cassette protein MsbA
VTGWRDRIAVVRQHPYIFNDTLRYNLTVDNREASEAEIKQACEIAQITEFLDELSDGLETHLGDEGVRLSGGQRQRVAIARAILKGGELLVFDEATSELDTRLEATVHSKLLDMDREFTLLVVAHRLSTVREADRIYALKNGRIAEAGTHDELIDDGGVYAKLHESKEYEPAEVPEGE